MMPFIYFTPIDWAVTIFAVVMLTLLIILWFLSVWKRKKHVYDAFGYVWRKIVSPTSRQS
ncbi:MAG: hypothetical protein IKK27_10760 [Alistipes sp.]|nr:hypothetical protein [Alistipes sp.]